MQRIAAIHHAELALGQSELGGLKVKVSFALPPRVSVKKRSRKLKFFNTQKR